MTWIAVESTIRETPTNRTSTGWPNCSSTIRARADGRLLGGTGLAFEGATETEAVTGYVLAKDAWGRGYASEALRTMIEVAEQLEVARIDAFCHADHRASWRVLEKCGFARDSRRGGQAEFPNLARGVAQDVLCYALNLTDPIATRAGRERQ